MNGAYYTITLTLCDKSIVTKRTFAMSIKHIKRRYSFKKLLNAYDWVAYDIELEGWSYQMENNHDRL